MLTLFAVSPPPSPTQSDAQIGLQSVYIIDAGKTALVEGLRVAPWERGKGVAGVLQRFCAEMVKEKYPGVQVSRLTRDDKLGPRDFKKYRVIAKQVSTLPTTFLGGGQSCQGSDHQPKSPRTAMLW